MPPDISLGRRALLGGGVVLGLGMIATGCGPAGVDRPTPSPSGPPGYDGPGLPQLTVEKLFTGEKVKLSQVFRATLVGGILVLGGRDADNRNAVAALDLTSGEPRWEVGDGARGGGVAKDVSLLGSDGWAADDGQSGILLEQFVRGGGGRESTEEFGMVALSLADRSLRWSAVTVPSKPRKSAKDGRFQTVHVVATTADTVVVNVGGDAIHGVEWNVHNPGQEPRTIGFDVRTGKKLWEVADTLTQLTAGGRLLAVRGSSPADSQPLALDSLSGKELWRMSVGEPASWIAAAGELGIIRTGQMAQLVGLSDGAPGPMVNTNPSGLPQLGTGFIEVVATTDAVPYAAWESGGEDYRLLTLGLADPEPLRAANAFSGHSLVMGAGGGYAWVMPSDGADRVMAVDRTGAVRSDEVSGFLRGLVGDLVITDGIDGGFAVHRYRPA